MLTWNQWTTTNFCIWYSVYSQCDYNEQTIIIIIIIVITFSILVSFNGPNNFTLNKLSFIL